MKKSKITGILAIVCMTSLLFSSCSSGTSSTPAAPAATTSAVSAPAAPAAPAAKPAEQKTYELKFSSSNPEGTPLAVFLDNLAADIEKSTNGQVKMQLFHGNQLGAPTDLVSMTKSGGIDLLNMGIGQAMGAFPGSDIVQVPFVVSNPTTAGEVMNRLYNEGYLNKEFDDANLKVLFFMPTDMQMIGLVKNKITAMEGLKGLKIRANSGSVVKAIEALGGTPVSITTTEVYMSLERGVIDGAISSPGAMNVFKYFEACDYLLNMPISTGLNFVAINKKLWDGMPAEIQVTMSRLAEKYYYEYLNYIHNDETSSLGKLKAGGMEPYEMSAAELVKFKNATSFLQDEYVKTVTGLGYDGAKILEQTKAVVARCEAHLGASK